MFRVAWKILKTGGQGVSEPMEWGHATMWATVLNKIHAGRIKHWIEERT